MPPQQPAPRFLRVGSRSMTRPWSREYEQQGYQYLARPTWMSLQWARPPNTPPMAPRGTPGTLKEFRAAAGEGLPPPFRDTLHRSPLVATPGGRLGSQLLSRDRLGQSPPTEQSLAMA